MRGYLQLFRRDLLNLSYIDIIIFSIFINLNTHHYFNREIQLVLAILIIKKSLIKHIYTDSIKILFFLAGSKTKIIILLNLIFNQLIYLFIAFLMYFLKVTTFHLVITNFIVFSLILCIYNSLF